ncbi:MAG: ATP-binding protein, partial [Methanolobus sp.]|nr:ATP-binding protein [Methanolobus sp.]
MTEKACDISRSRIKVLDESTINKIAAGEVVERPASVVKELLDNSIDAHASDIRVEIRGSGTKNITVADNGAGMSHT